MRRSGSTGSKGLLPVDHGLLLLSCLAGQISDLESLHACPVSLCGAADAALALPAVQET